MYTNSNISINHQPTPANVQDYGFMAYNQVQGWADIKEPKSSSS
jgi:hypothetical protein